MQNGSSCGKRLVPRASNPKINCGVNVLQGSQLRKDSIVLDFDKQWESDPGFVFYDFNDPENIPEKLRGSFEGVLIDPPFITPEVWEKYATTAKLLLKEGGKIICTTISGVPWSCDGCSTAHAYKAVSCDLHSCPQLSQQTITA